jgi:hypothetical protein
MYESGFFFFLACERFHCKKQTTSILPVICGTVTYPQSSEFFQHRKLIHRNLTCFGRHASKRFISQLQSTVHFLWCRHTVVEDSLIHLCQYKYTWKLFDLETVQNQRRNYSLLRQTAHGLPDARSSPLLNPKTRSVHMSALYLDSLFRKLSCGSGECHHHCSIRRGRRRCHSRCLCLCLCHGRHRCHSRHCCHSRC